MLTPSRFYKFGLKPLTPAPDFDPPPDLPEEGCRVKNLNLS